MNIILGVSGSIAAYKSAALIRLFVKEGHEVQVILTDGAADFITPLTLSTLSKRPVHTAFFKEEDGSWVNHVDLAAWADIIIIAPATAQTLAKMALGLCDNLLLAVYLSATCPVYAAPAMDRDMYLHFAVQKNIKTLEENKVNIIPPGEGELASGLIGQGRMAEPEDILDFVKKKARLITA